MLRIFRDSYETGTGADGRPRTGRSAEEEAISFYLEHRLGRRAQSPAAPDRLAMPRGRGRALSPVDVEATIRRIDRAIAIVPETWRPAVLVAIGFRLGVARLRAASPGGGMPYLERAGYAYELPRGLSASALRRWREHVRGALTDAGLIDRETARAVNAVAATSSARSLTSEEMMRAVGEQPLRSWKAIAAWLGVSERTARDYAARRGMPVCAVAGGVYAFPSQLAEWISAQNGTG